MLAKKLITLLSVIAIVGMTGKYSKIENKACADVDLVEFGARWNHGCNHFGAGRCAWSELFSGDYNRTYYTTAAVGGNVSNSGEQRGGTQACAKAFGFPWDSCQTYYNIW